MNMLKYITTLFFAIAAVAGDWPPQDHGQNQLNFPVRPQSQTESEAVFMPQTGLPVLPVGILHARPCRRRNFGSPVVSPNSGWVPVPVTQQPFGSQVVQPQFKPQSLTENRAPDTDDNNGSPYKSDKKSSNPTYFPENHNQDENERKRDTQDLVETDKTNQNNSPHIHIEDEHYHHHHLHTSGNKEDQHEPTHDSHECETHDDADGHEHHDESDHHSDGTSKAAPVDVHEEAVKLITKCVDEAKADSPQDDFSGESRRSNSPSEPKNREVVISPKSKETVIDKGDDSKSTNKVQVSSSGLDRLDPQVYNPAKDAGKYKSNPKVSLLQNGRVCYACSSYFDSSCWKPNSTTTVKYCYKNNNACLTRTFKVGDKTILTRDCGHTCNEDNPYGVGPKHTSCSMCHTDMCNSGFAITGLNVLLVTFVISAVTLTLQ